MTSTIDLAPGTQIGNCAIKEKLGEGGMGVVYRAVDRELDRDVAIKVIQPEHVGDSATRERFKKEARLAAALYHPNVAVVHSIGEDGGHLYCVMQWIDGLDLAGVIKRDGPLQPARAVAIVGQIANALDAAHEGNLLHRDVKSSNILVSIEATHEHAFLSDFGIARRMTAKVDDENVSLAGTPGYIAPERIRRQQEDSRSDVYSLACVLCEALTGRLPFPRSTTSEKLVAHMNEEPPRVSTLVDGLTEDMDDVVRRALAKDPADRFLRAGDLGRAALEAVEGSRRRTRQRAAKRGARPKADVVVGTPNGDFPTISAAVAAAAEGAMIGVRSGFYRESVRLAKKGLHLFADGPREEVILSSTGLGPAIVVAGEGCAVSWMTINGPRIPNPFGWSVRIGGDEVAVERCVITGEACGAILVSGARHVDIRRCRLRGMVRAVLVKHGSDVLLEDNDIFGTGYGLSLFRAIIHGDGILVDRGANAVILRNRLADVRGEGVVVRGAAEVRQNDISGAHHTGLYVSGSATARRNQVHDGHAEGVCLAAGAEVDIEDNDVFANRGAACTVVGRPSGRVVLNRFYANRGGELVRSSGLELIVEGNDVRVDHTALEGALS